MTETPKTIQRFSYCWPYIHTAGFFLLFAMQMTQYYYSSFYIIAFPYLFSALSMIVVAVYYAAGRFGDSQELKALTIYSCWVLITRIICGHFWEESDMLFVSGMFFFGFGFSVGL